MLVRVIKWGLIGTAGAGLVAALVFGRDAASYVGSSARSVQSAIKDAVPMEFELQRARDLLEEIIPQMHANVRLIAQEEVEIASLKTDLDAGRQTLAEQRTRVGKLRDSLAIEKASYTFGGLNYSRQQVKEELAHSFDHLKEAEVVFGGKQRLLETREKSLQAAMQMLDRTRTQKVHLEDQIASLESQYRLIQATAVASGVQIDNSKLAQTERLIGQIKKRLDVAERVLTHQAQFTQPINIDVIDEGDLLTQVSEYLDPSTAFVNDTPEPARSTTQPAVVLGPTRGLN